MPIGVVTAIAAPATLRVELSGEGGHAGAVLMADAPRPAGGRRGGRAGRRPRAARASGAEDTVGTVGLLDAGARRREQHPPPRAHGHRHARHRRWRGATPCSRRCAPRPARPPRRAACGHADEILNADGPATSDPAVAARPWRPPARRRASPACGWSAAPTTTACSWRASAPTAMIFVPSAGGVSHRPDEYTSRAGDRAGRAGARRRPAPAGRLKFFTPCGQRSGNFTPRVTSVAGTPRQQTGTA